MTSVAIKNTFPSFVDTNGHPLTGGRVYFGAKNADPLTSPIAVYYDEAQTIPATQPLRTAGGFLYRNGSPARVWAAGDCSILVLDANERQVFYAGEGQLLSASNEIFLQGGTGAVDRRARRTKCASA